jgi:thioredoxin-like negative regulator of GroEL
MKKIALALALPMILLAAACSREVTEKSAATSSAGSPSAATTESTATRSPADANGTPEELAQLQEARQLIAQGDRERARALLQAATARFPESRRLHQQYAELLWDLSAGKDPALLKQSGQEAARALEIALRSGEVDYVLTGRLAETLGRTGDRETLDRLFRQALERDPSAVVQLDYAHGLALMNDPRAEEALARAARLQPDGDAMVQYAEWLLDHGRNQEALDRLPGSGPLRYLHFLRGFALERLGRSGEAREEYAQFRDYSATFPAPERFRIPGSQAQAGIRFKESRGS